MSKNTNTLLIVGGALAAAYILTSKSTKTAASDALGGINLSLAQEGGGDSGLGGIFSSIFGEGGEGGIFEDIFNGIDKVVKGTIDAEGANTESIIKSILDNVGTEDLGNIEDIINDLGLDNIGGGTGNAIVDLFASIIPDFNLEMGAKMEAAMSNIGAAITAPAAGWARLFDWPFYAEWMRKWVNPNYGMAQLSPEGQAYQGVADLIKMLGITPTAFFDSLPDKIDSKTFSGLSPAEIIAMIEAATGEAPEIPTTSEDTQNTTTAGAEDNAAGFDAEAEAAAYDAALAAQREANAAAGTD